MLEEFSDKRLYEENDDDEDTQPDELENNSKNYKAIEKFNKVTVWGHDVKPDVDHDSWVVGLSDWIKLAETVSILQQTFIVITT